MKHVMPRPGTVRWARMMMVVLVVTGSALTVTMALRATLDAWSWLAGACVGSAFTWVVVLRMILQRWERASR